jgi:hypothetical protein
MPLLGPNPIALRPLELTSLYGPRDILQLAAPRARSRRLPDRTRRISLTKSTSPVSVRLAKRTQFGCACNPRGAPRAPASPILIIRPTSNSIHSEKSISFTSTGRIQRFIDVLALRAASIDSYCVGFWTPAITRYSARSWGRRPKSAKAPLRDRYCWPQAR